MIGWLDSPAKNARCRAFEAAQARAHKAGGTVPRKGLCMECGEVTPETVNHHPSYRPEHVYVVNELCKPCHDRAHRKLGWGAANLPDGWQHPSCQWDPPNGTPTLEECGPFEAPSSGPPLDPSVGSFEIDAMIAQARENRAWATAKAEEPKAERRERMRIARHPEARIQKRSAEAQKGSEDMSILEKATKGKIESPIRVLIYGTEGIGKSTMASEAPAPFFLGAEEGTRHLDVARLEVTTWAEAMATLDALATERHAYQSLVIDTLDWLEKLCHAHVCATKKDQAGNKHDTIDEFPFQAGYPLAENVWRKELIARLGRVYGRGLNIVLVAHAHVKKFKNPAGDDFMRYECKLRPDTYATTKEWVDAVLFAHFEELAVRNDKGKATGKGVSTGARLVHTEKRAAYDAKNRYGLPESMPLGWAEFALAAKGADPETLKSQIATTLATIGDGDVRARVTLAVEKAANDAPKLARILNHLNATKEAA